MSRFSDKIISIVKIIPRGNVASYGQIASLAGIPRAARQVGWVLHQRGGDPGVPWWRVINNKGLISIKGAEQTAALQKQLLTKESIPVTKKLEIDIENYRWKPTIEELKKASLPEKYIDELLNNFQI